jgi:hypothetical protein
VGVCVTVAEDRRPAISGPARSKRSASSYSAGSKRSADQQSSHESVAAPTWWDGAALFSSPQFYLFVG